MKHNKWITPVVILSITIGVFLIPGQVFASFWDSVWSNNGDQETINFLQKYEEYLQFGSFFTIMSHWLGWAIIKCLYVFTSAIEGLIPESLNLLNFLDDSGMQGLFKAIINDLVLVLMILTIVYLGFKTVIAKEPPSFKSVGVNIFLSAFLILGLPSLMDTMEDVSLKFFDATQTGENNDGSANLSWNLIQNNTVDLMYIASRGFSTLENESAQKNALTKENFNITNLNALIKPDTVSKLEGNEIQNLAYKLDTDDSGKPVADKIESSAFSFLSDSFDSGYFRYSTKFLPIIVGLLGLLFAYLFTIFVFASTAIEIGFKQVLAPIIFATDLETGQRTKMVVQDIANAFLLIAFTGLSFRLYTMFLSFLVSSNINIFVYIIALISATFVLIKGSNTTMRYFGVDVGLKDGFAQIAGAFAIGRSTAHVGRSLRNVLTKSDKINGFPNSNNSNKDALSEHVDSTRSVNDSKKGIGNTLKKSVNSAGKTVGYMRERGITGMAEDAIKGTGEKIGNNINSKMKSLTDGVKGIKDSWKQGIEEGELNGLGNQIKWKQQQGKQEKSINDSDSSLSYEDKGFLKSNDNNKNDTQKQKLQHDLNSINSSATSNISSDMKINPSVSSGNATHDVSVPNKGNVSSSVQKIIQQVEQTSFKDPQTAKQSIIQEVRNIPYGSDVKQRMIQEIEKASVASPQQLQQNVQQVLATANVPVSTQNAIQKVVQDVQKTSQSPEIVQAKVIQEIQKSSFGNETVKQTVIQDIQKAFAATPEQLQQNIKQVIEKTDPSSVTQEIKTKVTKDEQVNVRVNNQSNQKSYFKSILPPEFFEFEEVERKSSRFDKFKD